MSNFTYNEVESFGRHVLQDMIDTQRHMIADKCYHLAKQAKTGDFDEWAALATRDIFEMRRVIHECEVLQGDITGCLSNWLEKREQADTPNGAQLSDTPAATPCPQGEGGASGA